jgi:hypothetical protein
MDTVLLTELPLEECQRRIIEALKIEQERYHRVGGWVKEATFHIYIRPRYRNMFIAILVGGLESTPEGTIVRTRVQLPIASIVLTVLFVPLGLLFQCGNWFSLSSNWPFTSSTWFTFLLPSTVCSFACAVVLGVGIIEYLYYEPFLQQYVRRICSRPLRLRLAAADAHVGHRGPAVRRSQTHNHLTVPSG